MVEYNFRFQIEHTDADGQIEEIEVTADTKQEAINEAYRKIAGKYGISCQQVKSEWEHTGFTSIGFADAPWNTFSELKQKISSFDGVSWVRTEDPLDGAYSPPKLHIGVSSAAKANSVRNKIESYYDGLLVNQRGSKIVVIVSPIKNVDTN